MSVYGEGQVPAAPLAVVAPRTKRYWSRSGLLYLMHGLMSFGLALGIWITWSSAGAWANGTWAPSTRFFIYTGLFGACCSSQWPDRSWCFSSGQGSHSVRAPCGSRAARFTPRASPSATSLASVSRSGWLTPSPAGAWASAGTSPSGTARERASRQASPASPWSGAMRARCGREVSGGEPGRARSRRQPGVQSRPVRPRCPDRCGKAGRPPILAASPATSTSAYLLPQGPGGLLAATEQQKHVRPSDRWALATVLAVWSPDGVMTRPAQ